MEIEANQKPDQADAIRSAMSGISKREMKLENYNSETRTAELSFSSEIEYERFPGFIEVLSHDSGAVDLTRMNNGANVLFNHDQDCVAGVVEKAWIGSDRKGRAVVRFSKSEEGTEVWADVQDGILRSVSVGYKIKELKLRETREDGASVYLVTEWEPFEISIVSVPADATVGLYRGVQADKTNPPSLPPEKLSQPKITTMSDNTIPPADTTAIERDRVRSILAAGKEYNAPELAHAFASEGKSVDEFRSALLAEVNKRNQKVVEASKPVGLSDKEIRNFSFVTLLRALSDPQNPKAREAARFELEACQAAADKLHRSARGTVIPVEVLHSPMVRGDTISIQSGSGYTGTGGNTVATTLSSSFIDLLRKRTVAMQLGSQLSGLVGNVDIPKQTAGSSGYWIGEDAAAATEDVEFGIVELRGKTVASKAEITRKLLMQSSIDVEALVRSDLAKGLAETIDTAFFYGDGLNAAPKGIKNAAGINSLFWAASNAPTFAELVKMETEVANDNYSTDGSVYVMNSALRGYLKTTKKFGNSGADTTLWEPGNTLNGYRTEVSNQIAAGDIFFGDFSQAIIGLWGGLEITMDPYTHSDKGRLRLVAMQDVDFAVRQPVAFCYGFND
jgi:HK97 family phage major capsid protein/HK97 family phage prohead protease